MSTSKLPTLVGIGLLATLATAARADYYNVTDLGTLPGGSFSQAQGVNDGGQVVGFSGTAIGTWHAFRTREDGTLRDLGVLPGGSNSFAMGLNRFGDVVGYADDADGVNHAVRL